MKSKLRILAVILLLLVFTGCEAVEPQPEGEGTDGREGVTVEAQVKENAEEVMENAQKAMDSANEAIEGAKQAMEAEIIAEVPLSAEPQLPQPTAVPEPVTYEFSVGDKEYFSDALFIGDSRTVGLQLYGKLDNADYFAAPGLSLYSIPRTKVTVGEYTDVTLTELLEKKDYGKIYLMLGINELGYNFEKTLTKYHELVAELRTKEPQAILYACANLHVTDIRDENDEIHNNDNINRINAEIAALEDKKDIFYLDVNELFDDEAGNLNQEYASDDSHVLGTCYDDWCDWLIEHTIVK
ncbi:MAG: hypothetical protein IJ379_14570 [Lachnospiraceae bacterium]|nr:hypothetical protein [Lachnospiraceae bacterium]